MRIDQLALLLALVAAANLILLVALELPRFGRRGTRQETGPDSQFAAQPRGTVGERPAGREALAAGERRLHASAGYLSAALYQRVVRVVGFMFIGAVLVVASLTGGAATPAIYVLCALGLFLIVFFEDVLPAGALGRARMALEAIGAIGFLTALLIVTGGHNSPYFFGYILMLGAGALWASGLGPLLLAIVTSAAYIAAVLLVAGPTDLPPADVGRVAFNLVALALVTYVASVIGREQRRAREEALRLSRYDSLTGLHSRDHFLTEVDHEILRAARTGRPFALLMIDLDGLKAANDRFGHESGDQLLQAVAEVLRGDIRATDVAARYGGDEFVLMLPETDLAGALLVADKIRVDIGRVALPRDGAVIRTSASLGLVTYPDDGRSTAELMRRADVAMYEAKRRGRDQIVRYAREAGVPVGPGTGQQNASPVEQREEPSIPAESPGPAPWELPRR